MSEFTEKIVDFGVKFTPESGSSKCPKCLGVGGEWVECRNPADDWHECPKCHGTGRVEGI